MRRRTTPAARPSKAAGGRKGKQKAGSDEPSGAGKIRKGAALPGKVILAKGDAAKGQARKRIAIAAISAPAQRRRPAAKSVLQRPQPPSVAAEPDVPGAMLRIGSRLHHARLLREARMKDVAEAAGCSESLISKIENNKVTPSLRVLHRLCEALNLPLGELLASSQENGAVVTKADQRRIVTIDPLRTGTGIRLERLVPYSKGHLLQGNIHVIAPGGSSDGDITHDGEEVGYVISGRIALVVDGQVHAISAGDSFCYRSELPHGYRNIGDTEARVLFVNTPPTF
jgi:transcriptional regulator with XRE-family HTH domain